MSDIPVGVRYSDNKEVYPYIFVDIGDEIYLLNETNGMLDYDIIFNREAYLEIAIVPTIITINTSNDEEANSILEKIVDKISESYLVEQDESLGVITREEVRTQRAIEKTASSKEPIFVATMNMGIRVKQIKKR